MGSSRSVMDKVMWVKGFVASCRGNGVFASTVPVAQRLGEAIEATDIMYIYTPALVGKSRRIGSLSRLLAVEPAPEGIRVVLRSPRYGGVVVLSAECTQRTVSMRCDLGTVSSLGEDVFMGYATELMVEAGALSGYARPSSVAHSDTMFQSIGYRVRDLRRDTEVNGYGWLTFLSSAHMAAIGGVDHVRDRFPGSVTGVGEGDDRLWVLRLGSGMYASDEDLDALDALLAPIRQERAMAHNAVGSFDAKSLSRLDRALSYEETMPPWHPDADRTTGGRERRNLRLPGRSHRPSLEWWANTGEQHDP